MLCPLHLCCLVLALAPVLTSCDDAARTIAQRTEAAPPPQADARFFHKAELSSAVQLLRQKLGTPVNVLRFEILPNRLVIQVQNPVHPSRVEQYALSSNVVSAPEPVRLDGPGTLEPNLFPLQDLPLAEIEAMAAAAVDHVDRDRGAPTRLVARRGVSEDRAIQVRLFVASPVFDGYLDFDATGKPLDAP